MTYNFINSIKLAVIQSPCSNAINMHGYKISVRNIVVKVNIYRYKYF